MHLPFVNIATDTALPASVLLEQILNTCGFWTYLEEKRQLQQLTREEFIILIKPDLEIFEAGSITGTNPLLVEHLISLLNDLGYTNCKVAGSDGDACNWLDNREVAVLADLAGYHYVTETGVSYDVINLSEQLEEGGFDSSGVLAGSLLSAHWQNAHFRILFCKNKTDEEFYYSLCLKNLIDILPLRAKDYHYYFKHQPEELAHELYKRNQVHFCLMDAFISNHGIQGSRHQKALATHTIIAGSNPLLTDWVAALKMGLDPYCSSINGYVLRKEGLPKKYSINGNIDIYKGWKNVPKILAESVRSRNAQPVLRQLAKSWLQKTDAELFPFKNVADGQVNRIITSFLKDIDEHPLSYMALVALNYMLTGVNHFVNGWNVLFDKERIFRRTTSIGFEINEYSKDDFEELENYINPFAQIVTHTTPDSNGLKWRYIDDSIVFEFSRTLPYDYQSFVSRVDIAQSVQYMFDNIGGKRVPVKTNNEGKVIYQAERDIYLPQPNWMVVFGGRPIDVCKIEVIRYKAKQQTICWKTVKSLNDSADFDDGLVTFSPVKKGITEIKIVARQKFALPLFWQVFDIDYVPKVKDALVSDSYIRFFSRTIANFEAVYEGRSPYIGRIIDESWGENDKYSSPLQADHFQNIFKALSGTVEKWIKRKNNGVNTNYIDENGYRHFNGSATDDVNPGEEIRSFVTDVSKAIQKDILYLTKP